MADYWPRGEEDQAATPAMRELSRLWKPLPKILFSSTLEHVKHNARLVRGDLDKVLAELRWELRGDLEVGGPNLAGQFVRRGLVDESTWSCHPVILGAGTPLAAAGYTDAPPARRDAHLLVGSGPDIIVPA